MRDAFSYLVAVMDRASRFVLSWELDNTLEAGFCVSAPEEALERCVGGLRHDKHLGHRNERNLVGQDHLQWSAPHR